MRAILGLLIIGGGADCAARPLGVPLDADEEPTARRWQTEGCPYLTPWRDSLHLGFVADDGSPMTWRAILRESLPRGRERRKWTIEGDARTDRYEEITASGCGVASWRPRHTQSGVTTGPYVFEVPPAPEREGAIDQADGSFATYRFRARSLEEAGARYRDCFEIDVVGERIGPTELQDRVDVYCLDVGLVLRTIDGHVYRRSGADAG